MPETVAKSGELVTVPLDPSALEELVGLFSAQPTLRQDWLLIRFPRCESDAEAVRIAISEGMAVSVDIVKTWKHRDPEFLRVYELLSSRCVDWARHLAFSIEAENAVYAAMQKRKLILTPWDDMDGRQVTAKMQACSDSIDRVLGKEKQAGTAIILLTDLIPGR